MQEQLRALVRLAEIDASARDIDEQLEGIPLELEERKAAVNALESLVGGQRMQLEEAEALLNQQDTELKDRSDSLARSKAKSAKARNLREAQAAEREIEAVRRSIRDGETEKERLQGVLEQTRKILEEPLKELAEQQKALQEALEGSEERLGDLRKRRDEALQGRDEFAAKIDKKVLRRYEQFRTKIKPMVVEARDGICTGCRMRLPPQLFNQIVSCKDLYQCPQCKRYLYYKDAII